MKTAEEYFDRYKGEYLIELDGNCLDLDAFQDALAEHDKEIGAKIDEMIKCNNNRGGGYNEKDNFWDDGYESALTELKKKIEA